MSKRRTASAMQNTESAESLSENESILITEEEDEKSIESCEESISEHKIASSSTGKKKKKRGIIYLSTIPKYMNVIKIRETFSVYGKVERVYLQLAATGKNSFIYNNLKVFFTFFSVCL